MEMVVPGGASRIRSSNNLKWPRPLLTKGFELKRLSAALANPANEPPDPEKRSPGIAGTMHGAGLEGTRRAASFQDGPSHTTERWSTVSVAVSEGAVAEPELFATRADARALGGAS